MATATSTKKKNVDEAQTRAEAMNPELVNAQHVEKVRKVQGRIDKQMERSHQKDGDLVHDRILLGREFTQWKAWLRSQGKKLDPVVHECTGIDPRNARRHMAVARASWAGDFETSELTSVLPGDLLKLEMLAKLSAEQILQLCGEDKMFLRRTERSALASLVKALLPVKSKRDREPGRRLLTLARRLRSKSDDIIPEWQELGVKERDRDTVLDELKAVVNTLEQIEIQDSGKSPRQSVNSVEPAGNDVLVGVA
jgi:hypothetical protein